MILLMPSDKPMEVIECFDRFTDKKNIYSQVHVRIFIDQKLHYVMNTFFYANKMTVSSNTKTRQNIYTHLYC